MVKFVVGGEKGDGRAEQYAGLKFQGVSSLALFRKSASEEHQTYFKRDRSNHYGLVLKISEQGGGAIRKSRVELDHELKALLSQRHWRDT